MKVYVETNPETVYSGRVKDEVKTTEIRIWFETDEEIEVLSLADYTKQVRKKTIGDLKEQLKKNGKCSIRVNGTMDFFIEMDKLNEILDQIQGE